MFYKSSVYRYHASWFYMPVMTRVKGSFLLVLQSSDDTG